MTPSLKLANKIIAWDECYPGEPESSVEITYDEWATFVDLAGQIIATSETDEES